jgi:chromosomal replication initiation ATPase DnaA
MRLLTTAQQAQLLTILNIYSTSFGQEFTELKQAVKDMTTVNSGSIIDIVASVTGVTVADMKSPSRLREIADARCLLFGLYVEYSDRMTYAELGRMVNKDHSTVVFNLGKFRGLTDTDPAFRAKREKCEAMLREKTKEG